MSESFIFLHGYFHCVSVILSLACCPVALGREASRISCVTA